METMRFVEPLLFSKSITEIQQRIKEVFKIEISEKEIEIWLEPTLGEDIKDVQQQYRNLNL